MDITMRTPPKVKDDDGNTVQTRMLEITLRFDLTVPNVWITNSKLPSVVEAATIAAKRALKDTYGTEGTAEGDWRYVYGPWASGRVIDQGD